MVTCVLMSQFTNFQRILQRVFYKTFREDHRIRMILMKDYGLEDSEQM